MTEPTISYVPRPDGAPEVELNALAACYRIILDSAKRRRRLDKSEPDDKKNTKEVGDVRRRSR